MQALHFGAGNIGRGFIGRVLSNSGFNVIFSDINQKIVNSINYYKTYKIKLVGYNFKKTINVENVSAVNFYDPNILNVISNVDLITTAVGVNSLEKLALILIKGIILKINSNSTKPLNIIACENKIKASSFLKKIIFDKIAVKYRHYLHEYIGFVDCSIDTIIPSFTSSKKENDLFVISENFQEWIVDANQFKGRVPKIMNMQLSDNLISFVDRKILTLNTGHAVAAYLGLLKKYKTMYETMSNCKISQIVKNAMIESGAMLIKHYNFDQKNHISYINNIFIRFKNPFLFDTLERIARNPLQKLSKNERLIRPILGATKYHLPCSNLIQGAAAAFHYYNFNDIESIKLSSFIKKDGIEKTLIKVSNLDVESKVAKSIISEYYSIIKNI